MCDRTRELCMERYAGMYASDNVVTFFAPFTETHWTHWEEAAAPLLETLERHK